MRLKINYCIDRNEECSSVPVGLPLWRRRIQPFVHCRDNRYLLSMR